MSSNAINGHFNGRELTQKKGHKVMSTFCGRKTIGSRQYRRKLERLAKRQERKQNA
tara:strand:+ start:255 stop:422 length:168 start_codon:yes stop_codon:yes gene_type:complete